MLHIKCILFKPSSELFWCHWQMYSFVYNLRKHWYEHVYWVCILLVCLYMYGCAHRYTMHVCLLVGNHHFHYYHYVSSSQRVLGQYKINVNTLVTSYMASLKILVFYCIYIRIHLSAFHMHQWCTQWQFTITESVHGEKNNNKCCVH